MIVCDSNQLMTQLAQVLPLPLFLCLLSIIIFWSVLVFTPLLPRSGVLKLKMVVWVKTKVRWCAGVVYSNKGECGLYNVCTTTISAQIISDPNLLSDLSHVRIFHTCVAARYTAQEYNKKLDSLMKCSPGTWNMHACGCCNRENGSLMHACILYISSCSTPKKPWKFDHHEKCYLQLSYSKCVVE